MPWRDVVWLGSRLVCASPTDVMKYTNEDEGLAVFSVPRSGLIRIWPYWFKATRDLLDREDQHALHIQYCGGWRDTHIPALLHQIDDRAIHRESNLCFRAHYTWGLVGEKRWNKSMEASQSDLSNLTTLWHIILGTKPIDPPTCTKSCIFKYYLHAERQHWLR